MTSALSYILLNGEFNNTVIVFLAEALDLSIMSNFIGYLLLESFSASPTLSNVIFAEFV